MVLKFILRDELDKELEEQKNFNYLVKVKTECSLIFESIIADFSSPIMESYLKNMFKTHDIEILGTKGQMSDALSLNNFSQRSLDICETHSNTGWLMPNLPEFDD